MKIIILILFLFYLMQILLSGSLPLKTQVMRGLIVTVDLSILYTGLLLNRLLVTSTFTLVKGVLFSVNLVFLVALPAVSYYLLMTNWFKKPIAFRILDKVEKIIRRYK